MDTDHFDDYNDVQDIDLIPPSPPQNNASFDYSPSYPASYNNSPYSVHSELSFDGDDHSPAFALFPGGAPQNPSYDPAEYDNPSGTTSLLMFNDTDYISPYDPQPMQQPQVYGDYSSPASSNGGDDGNQSRSRASSVSSNHAHQQQPQPQQHHLSPSPNMQPRHLTPSPRMSVTQSFEGMSFRSPSWPNEPLPEHSPRQSTFGPNISPGGPLQKPQSPPRLLMPDSDEGLPSINAPDGAGAGEGPTLHIVPATPVSGGGANDPGHQGLSFRNGPNLSPGYQQPPRHHSLSPAPSESLLNGPSTSSSSANGPSSSPNLFPAQRTSRSKSDGGLERPTWDTVGASGSSATLNDSAIVDDIGVNMNDVSPSSPPTHQQQQGRMNAGFTFGAGSTGGQPTNGSMNGFLSPSIEANSLRRSKSDGYSRPGHIRQSRSEDLRFGGGLPGINIGGDGASGGGSLMLPHDDFRTQQAQLRGQQFLTPSTGGGQSYPSQHQHHSNELGLSGSQLPNLGGAGLHAGRPTSAGGGHIGHIRRASSGSRSERGASVSADDYVSTSHSLRASPYPSPNVSPRGRFGELPSDGPYGMGMNHHQRSQSDSGGINLGIGGGGLPGPGMTFGSPNNSYNNHQHQPHHSQPSGFGIGGLGNMGGHGSLTSPPAHLSSLPHNTLQGLHSPPPPLNPNIPVAAGTVTVGGTTVPLAVTKMTVTTGRTAKASHGRRKQEATFHCPVPGCGSTFTRSFNLKGHIRSHNEEKPFLCHWPGCGKGFARQHDCKRHEQLHTNYRPFTCEGCQKPFARMDALNRHLRSEGGAECQRTLEQNGTLPPGAGDSPNGGSGKRGSKDGPAKSLPIPITPNAKLEHEEWKMEEGWPTGGAGNVAL